jgi:hypothetical protein
MFEIKPVGLVFHLVDQLLPQFRIFDRVGRADYQVPCLPVAINWLAPGRPFDRAKPLPACATSENF